MDKATTGIDLQRTIERGKTSPNQSLTSRQQSERAELAKKMAEFIARTGENLGPEKSLLLLDDYTRLTQQFGISRVLKAMETLRQTEKPFLPQESDLRKALESDDLPELLGGIQLPHCDICNSTGWVPVEGKPNTSRRCECIEKLKAKPIEGAAD